MVTTKRKYKHALLAVLLLVQAELFLTPAAARELASPTQDSITRLWPDNLFAVEFVDAKHGIVAGEYGRVLHTADGGDSWNVGYIGSPELVRRISYGDPHNVWAVGNRGSIFYSADGGNSWGQQYQEAGVYLRDVSFVDARHGWAVGHGATILHTVDGGESWQKQQLTGYMGRDLPRLHGVVALSADKAVAVGEFGVIAHTENGGELWVITPVDLQVTWTAIDGQRSELVVVGLDGNAGLLTVASNEQRVAIERSLRQQAEEEEARRRRKAQVRKIQYEPREIEVQLQVVEYVLTPVETGIKEHLFDVDYQASGAAVMAGRGVILGLQNHRTLRLEPESTLPVQFMWFGGVTVTASRKFVAVGIRGAVVEGDLSDNTYGAKLTVGGPVPEAITVTATNWSQNND